MTGIHNLNSQLRIISSFFFYIFSTAALYGKFCDYFLKKFQKLFISCKFADNRSKYSSDLYFEQQLANGLIVAGCHDNCTSLSLSRSIHIICIFGLVLCLTLHFIYIGKSHSRTINPHSFEL